MENKNRRIIFLDIDGVLSTYKEYGYNCMSVEDYFKQNPWAEELKVKYPFNKECVKILNEIFEIYEDIKIVLTSDWRKYWNHEQLKVIFIENGLTKWPEDITKITKTFGYDNIERIRAGEISEYLESHNMLKNDNLESDYKWIIIDDISVGMYMPETLKHRFVWVNEFDGLSAVRGNDFSDSNKVTTKEHIIELLK